MWVVSHPSSFTHAIFLFLYGYKYSIYIAYNIWYKDGFPACYEFSMVTKVTLKRDEKMDFLTWQFDILPWFTLCVFHSSSAASIDQVSAVVSFQRLTECV